MENLKDIFEHVEYLNEKLDSIYYERNLMVALSAKLAIRLGMNAGIKKDDRCDIGKEWENIIYIDLKDGDTISQISYHIHASELPNFSFLGEYKNEWDGHDTEEKLLKIETFLRSRSHNK